MTKSRKSKAKASPNFRGTGSRATQGGLTTKNDFTIGLDLGGTKVAVALVDHAGRIIEQTSRPVTPPSMPQLDPRDPYEPTSAEVRKHVSHVVTSMADAAREVAEALPVSERRRIRGLGLASAGPMDIGKGLLIDVSNMKGWKKVSIVQKLKDACLAQDLHAFVKKPIGFQNDAIAAALGEGWIGLAKKANTYIMLTVGTGIGTGVILNGQPAQSQGMGSEWGHIIGDVRGFSTRANRAYDSEVEGIASGTGLVRQAKLRGWKFENGHQIAEAARKGDPHAIELFMHCSEALAGLFYTLSLGFNPEVFAVSGGMLGISELFLPQAISIYQEAIRSKYPAFEKKIRVSKLGTTAGVIGAARLARL
jgi:glucokinase